MIRLILVIIFLLLFVISNIIFAPIAWILGAFNKPARDQYTKWYVKSIFRGILFLSGTRVTVSGIENIPSDSSVVYMCNHNSFFDVLITYVKIPYVFGFVSKKEVGKVPILHMWMRYVNCLFLDRNNIREGLKTILTGIDMVKNGTSLFIFPEGTRSKDGHMIPFKEGAMKLATKSKAPVIPIAMRGTSDIFESHLPFIKGSKVTMVVGKPIYIDELSPEDKKHSGAYVQGVIQNMLDEIDKNN